MLELSVIGMLFSYIIGLYVGKHWELFAKE